MRRTDWVSAHVFFHGDLDTLLENLVSPLAGELMDQGLTRRFFFLRYWDGGPHVRLRVLPADERSGEHVREHIARRCEEYLSRHPAPDRMTHEEYLRWAALLAQREEVTPSPHLYPNNSVEFIPYVRERHRFGTGPSIEAVERHFGESSQIALELLSPRPSAQHRDTAAFTLILLTWLLCDPYLTCLVSYLGQDRPVASDLDDHYRRQRARMLAIGEQLLLVANLLPRLPHTGSVTRWAWSVTRTRNAVADEIARGRFAPAPGDAGALPVLDQCAHLMCNRLGVPADGESMLRYLAGRTVSDLAKEG